MTTEDYADYLGDGVYVSFDGYQICLKANSYSSPTDTIYLEASVFNSLIRYVDRMKELGASL